MVADPAPLSVDRDLARRPLLESAEVLRRTADVCAEHVFAAAETLVRSLRAGGRLLICGNGGSAADAQHFATEFVSTLTLDRPRRAFPAIALTTDTSLLTAIANDFGIDEMFARQVEAHGRAGDVLVCISTSGDSANVLHAAERARERDLRVIALTGESGGALAGAADVAIKVPSTVTAHIQEAHLTIEHTLAALVEDELAPR